MDPSEWPRGSARACRTFGVQADIYSVGGVIYTMLTGEAPPKNIDGKGRQRGVSEEARVEGVSSAQREALGEVLRTALRTRPENRYQSFAAMRAALAAVSAL